MKIEIIDSEIKRLRRLLKSPVIPEHKKDQAWVAMLTLQWVKQKKPKNGFSPLTFVMPRMDRRFWK